MTAVTPSMVSELSATLVEQDQLGAAGRLQNPGLLLQAQIAVHLHDAQAGARGEFRAGALGPANLARAGKEYQDVAVDSARGQPSHRLGDLLLQRLSRMRRVRDFEIEQTAFALHRRARRKIAGDGPGVERRRHHHQAQIRPRRSLQAPQQRQGEIGVEMALVKLVQNHRRHPAQLGIVHQTPDQEAFGDVEQPRLAARGGFEPDLVSDGRAQGFPAHPRHPLRRGAGGDAARLQNQDRAGESVQQRGRNQRGLPRPGRSDNDQVPDRLKIIDDLRDQRFKPRRRAAAHRSNPASRRKPSATDSTATRPSDNLMLAARTAFRVNFPDNSASARRTPG